ncbi:MAG: type IX secretion system membrane protein PorP/SprF [Bacteroidota bacterium]
MNRKKKWVFRLLTGFLTGTLFAVPLFSQQHPFYSQYMIDKFLINPAVAGANGITTINFISRQQYVGFENPPQTFALTGQTRLMEDSYIMRRLKLKRNEKNASRSGRVGIGGSIYTDRNGIVSRTGFQGTYAYHLTFNNQWQLSMGLSVQGYQYVVDDRDSYITDPSDPLLANNRTSFFVPDASVGLFATTGSLFGGVTFTDLFGSNIKLGKDIFQDYRTLRQFNALAGYRFDLNDNLAIEPSFLVQGTKTNFSLDVNARAYYRNDFWAGLSYRSNKTLVVMAGGTFDMFYLGYAYDVDLGVIRTYSAGSHELIFGLKFGDNSTRRFRWIRKDQRNFLI